MMFFFVFIKNIFVKFITNLNIIKTCLDFAFCLKLDCGFNNRSIILLSAFMAIRLWLISINRFTFFITN
ncbi:hypothetical protein AS889_18090 [Pseudomonas putida]|nr:hypothetical protein AS889_18090 [Pseudomonas putida]